MKKLVAFYSRADENYFQGKYRYITVGNTEKVAKVIAKETGAELFKLSGKIPYAQDYQTCISQAKKDLNNHVEPRSWIFLMILVNMMKSILDTQITGETCLWRFILFRIF